MKERLQKILSAAGVCSRRAAEGYLTAGRITVNGETAQLGQQADPETDDIRVDGVPLGREPETVYLMLNKPRGYVTTVSDEQGRKTVMDLLTGVHTRIYPVGRLDRDSEGLLLLTNDGALTQRLLHPSHEVSKEYRVTVSGPVEHAAENLHRIRDVAGMAIRPAEVQMLRREGNRAELRIVIHEGRNRQIRRMCARCGLEVLRLQRVREHCLELGTLPLGQWRYLTAAEIAALKTE
ncbi:MAG: rRNA pseudouridine synthase [Clostridiales bacterium]|nr:rRNA pseudouridine synthase [Clostridiales bacterium]